MRMILSNQRQRLSIMPGRKKLVTFVSAFCVVVVINDWPEEEELLYSREVSMRGDNGTKAAPVVEGGISCSG